MNTAIASQRPSIQVAVTMRKERVTGAAARWQEWRWRLHDVAPHQEAFGGMTRCLHSGEEGVHWLFPSHTVELYKDDAEGYYLNATTAQPCWFVMWRMEESPSVFDEPLAVPLNVSLSYNDAGKWLDAQETVEQVPCSVGVAQWIAQFAEAHFVAEPKKRKRPESFRRLEDRFGNPVRISAGQKYGGGDGA